MLSFSRKSLPAFLALIAAPLCLASQPVAQQPAPDAQLLGKEAVHALLQHIILIANNPTPKTMQQLPPNGRWSIGNDAPPACPAPPPDNAGPCLRVIYRVAEADVSCEWVVLLDKDGSNGTILDQNDDATHYFMHKLSPESLKPLVLTRSEPTYPPIAIAAHLQGVVQFQIVVSPAGKPLSAAVISGPPMLTGAAKEAIAGWTFKPLQIGTRAVPFQTMITFNFVSLDPPIVKVTSIP